MEDFEDTEYVASEHDRLINAVSKLDKTQHITEPTRNEPSLTNSEFNLNKRSNKLDLRTVAQLLTNTAGHVKIAKKLKKIQDKKRVLPKPLEKPQAERVKRATGYEQTKKLVGRWDPVVAKTRSVDSVSFPLKTVTHKLQQTNEFLSKLKLKSELERELEELDPPMEVEEEDEEKLYPMSYEEMVEHRQHLAKLRAQQSYNAAKAKRQSKIKSKKYHRILKKEKLKQQLKEFEQLQKTDPEEALKKLEVLEKARALERHTLRHKNTGKWAKNKMIRAKYDKEVRNQLAEQLAVSRNLTQKTKDLDNSDEDGDDEEIMPDLALAQDPMNPWLMSQKDKSNVNAEFDFGYKKYLKERMFKRQEDSESDSENENKMSEQNDLARNEDFAILKSGITKLCKENNEVDEIYNISFHENVKESPTNKNVKDIINTNNKKKIDTKKASNEKNVTIIKPSKVVATSVWRVEPVDAQTKLKKPVNISTVFETLENKTVNQVEKKLNRLRDDIKQLDNLTGNKKVKIDQKQQKTDMVEDSLEYLKLRNKNTKAIIDEELIETTSKKMDNTNDVDSENKLLENIAFTTETSTNQIAESKETKSDIDPTSFIAAKPKFLNSVVPEGKTGYDHLDDDDQVVPRVNIEEVFEEDDVVASFRQEKEDEINKDKEDIVVELPGWGSWGGKGIKAKTPKRKRNRFIQKPAPVMPRRDENKGDIIIKEYKDPKLLIHKVKELPYPFKSVKDYEASIRAPVSNTFIPDKPFKQLIRPSVITKAGTIIEPMDEEELLLPKNRRFNKTDIIKIVSNK